MLIAILLFIMILVIDIITEYRNWIARIISDNAGEILTRGTLMFPTVGILSYHQDMHWIPSLINSFFLLMLAWWLLYDGIFNLIRGFGWWFNGQKEAIDSRSKLDKWIITLPFWKEVVVKIVPLLLSSIIYSLYFV